MRHISMIEAKTTIIPIKATNSTMKPYKATESQREAIADVTMTPKTSLISEWWNTIRYEQIT